jgi:hypothetical protein
MGERHWEAGASSNQAWKLGRTNCLLGLTIYSELAHWLESVLLTSIGSTKYQYSGDETSFRWKRR